MVSGGKPPAGFLKLDAAEVSLSKSLPAVLMLTLNLLIWTYNRCAREKRISLQVLIK